MNFIFKSNKLLAKIHNKSLILSFENQRRSIMKNKSVLLLILLVIFSIFSCSKEDNNDVTLDEPSLIVKFKFDPDQERLNNLGQSSVIPVTNAGQTPNFNSISAHYFELAPSANTQLGKGAVLYHAPETTIGGAVAIDFSQSKIVTQDEIFLKIPLKNLSVGSYQYVRVSLSYQNFSISIRNLNEDYPATLASFVGFNTYIGNQTIGNNFFPINANKLQGFWLFALNNGAYSSYGQAPANATTVPNPIASSSPIPAGSCVVTGKFANNLLITSSETQDVNITLSLSINKSFEWKEVTFDGKFEPAINEQVVDMGLRGLIPSYTK